MAKGMHRLSAMKVAKVTERGCYSDGGGLYLQVTRDGVKSWVLRYMRQGKARTMGLGPIHTVSLADARVKAMECRKLLLAGVDPLQARQAEAEEARARQARSKTFVQCCEAYIEAHKAGWRSAKHADQWTNTLTTYAYPELGNLSVTDITVDLVMKVLEPIWTAKNETASRLRGRIEAVLDWATVRGYRAGDNPARWRGHLDHLLPQPSKIKRVEHHAALPYVEITSFVTSLKSQEGFAARALELLILTAARTGSVIAATVGEFDLENKIWTIPPGHMKGNKEHRVPLAPQIVSLLVPLCEGKRNEDFVFRGRRDGEHLSNMAMLQLLKRMNRNDLTAHGFRSTFRDWAGECTNHPREVAEAALAHTLTNKVEAAYARGDMFIKRSLLMQDWASYCYQKK
ncbi:integrase arm-type DNA-binding domain-containing protein [Chromobacterium piscinae]